MYQEDPLLKAQAQVEFCVAGGLPLAAPANGICWVCNRQIYDAITRRKASKTRITDCPFCNKSFGD